MDGVDYLSPTQRPCRRATSNTCEAIVRLPTTYQVNGSREISEHVFKRAEVVCLKPASSFAGSPAIPSHPDVFDAWTTSYGNAGQRAVAARR